MAIDDSLARTVERNALTMRGTVLGRGATGLYDTPVKTGLLCYLEPLNQGMSSAQTSQARSELAARGRFTWERGYAMPASVRITVDALPGTVWNLIMTTAWPDLGPGGTPLSYHADAMRAS